MLAQSFAWSHWAWPLLAFWTTRFCFLDKNHNNFLLVTQAARICCIKQFKMKNFSGLMVFSLGESKQCSIPYLLISCITVLYESYRTVMQLIGKIATVQLWTQLGKYSTLGQSYAENLLKECYINSLVNSTL